MHLRNGSPVRWTSRHSPVLSLLALTLLLEPQGCRQGCDATATVAAPSINSIAPMTAVAGGPGFTLHVTGNLVDGLGTFAVNALVRWNGSDRPTRWIDALNLEATIPSADIAAPGTARVTVFNPGWELQDEGQCIFRFLQAESSPVTLSIAAPSVPSVSRPAAAPADSFLPPANLLASLGFTHRPLLALDDSANVYLIAEQQLPGRATILFARSSDRGSTFSAPFDLAASPSLPTMPDLTSEGAAKLFVLWRHESDASPGATPAESVALLLLSVQMIDRQQGVDWRRDPKSQLALNALYALAAGDSRAARERLNSFAEEVVAPQSVPLTDQQAGFLRSLARFVGSLLKMASAGYQ